jgi:hypothetical protein
MAYDANFDKRKLLLHFDGVDGSTTFTDVTGKTVTAAGNAHIETDQSKFGGASGQFDGTGDYLQVPASADFSFGTGDLTLEAWVYLAGDSASAGEGRFANIVTVANINTTVYLGFVILGDGTTTGTGLRLYEGLNNVGVNTTITKNTWHHLAVTRSGSTVRFWVDGTQAGTDQTYTRSLGSSSYDLFVGGHTWIDFNYVLNGYIDDLRITKGLAEYTANFTPPTEAFPDSATPEESLIDIITIKNNSQLACMQAGFIYALGM